MRVLLLYLSRDGQTQGIMSYIAHLLKDSVDCDVIDLSQADRIDLSQYQQVMIGAPVRHGRFNPILMKFTNQYSEQLNQIPSAFFAVNLIARNPEKQSPQSNVYVRKFLLKSLWHPQRCAVFAGALRYSRYRWFDRLIIQLIMRITGGETDTSKDVEYTDWQQVTCFAHDFAKMRI